MAIDQTGWQRIGRGRTGVQPCRKIEVLAAAAHETKHAAVRVQACLFGEVLSRLAFTSPRFGRREQSWCGLPARALESSGQRH